MSQSLEKNNRNPLEDRVKSFARKALAVYVGGVLTVGAAAALFETHKSKSTLPVPSHSPTPDLFQTVTHSPLPFCRVISSDRTRYPAIFPNEDFVSPQSAEDITRLFKASSKRITNVTLKDPLDPAQ